MMSETNVHILLVEDDGRLAALTREYLEKHEALVTVARDGPAGLKEALARHYDAILLDIMLPGMDGIEVCRRLHEQSDTPVIMITARGEEADRVLGLEIGADDYLPKPYSTRELLARIRAVVRRARGQTGLKRQQLEQGDLSLDPGSATARLKGNELDLTAYEFALLYALAKNAGRVMNRDRLMDLAKGNSEESFDRSIDVHISRLRKKLGDDPRRPRRIRTVRGLGYLYMAEGGR